MPAKVSNEFEMAGEAGIGQHLPAIAADRKDATGLDGVVRVEVKQPFRSRHGSAIADGLAIIFALRFERADLEKPIGRREKANAFKLGGNLAVVDCQGPRGDKSRIGKACLLRDPLEITPVKRTRQAFTVKDRVGEQRLGHPAIRIDIGKIQLAAGLEQSVRCAEHRALVSDQVDHAIGHDYVERGICKIS